MRNQDTAKIFLKPLLLLHTLMVRSTPQPPNPPRKSYAVKPTITNEGLQSLYEDPDALQVKTEPG